AVSQLPYLLSLSGTPPEIVVVTSGSNARAFIGSGPYTEQFFLQDTLANNTAAHEIVFTDTQGDVFRFNDFSTAEPGVFKSFTDPDGNNRHRHIVHGFGAGRRSAAEHNRLGHDLHRELPVQLPNFARSQRGQN